MEGKVKQPWSLEETDCLVALWSSAEVQNKLDGATRTKPVFEQIQRDMAALGYVKTVQQIINKVKKLKMEYRNQKRELRPRRKGRENHHFEVMDSILGERSMCQQTRASSSAAAMGDALFQSSSVPDDPSFNHIDADEEQKPPLNCSLPSPACTSGGQSSMFSSYKTRRDASLCCWSNAEVQALLTLWAHPTVQSELLFNVRNNTVYSCLSAKLASLGFNKTPKKCREKIKKLKQEYKKIKMGPSMGKRNSVWFSVMDEVLHSQAHAGDYSDPPESSSMMDGVLSSQAAASYSDPGDSSSAKSSPPTQSLVLDADNDDDIMWLPDEIQVLMTLWAQPNIQRQLLTSETNEHVFTYLSNELALVGFIKTPLQCSLKVENLKAEYNKIKQVTPYNYVGNDWFAILDSVLGSNGEASKDVDSRALLTEPKSPEEQVNDTLRAVWTAEEVQVLLTHWAKESIQEQLRSNETNKRVFALLSSELATQGFDKTTHQCRTKIKLLKLKYKIIKEQKDAKKQRSRWFTIMDRVLGRHKPGIKTEQAAEISDSDPPSPQDLPEQGCHLSISSLCLLVPTLRLMSAFAWQVVQSGNVVHYGKVEELVRSVTQLAPELLTPRENVQLLLRLRARLVLELCHRDSTANLLNIQRHLKVIQDLTISSSCDQEELEELENSKSNFEEIVQTLLKDSDERKRFFKEVFPIHYGQQYEATLRTLVWKFISKLDSLLPVPDIKQTAEWLGTAPSVLEECGQLVLESDQLKALLHFHQQQSESSNRCYSQAQNMFLPTLSLHHKGSSAHFASEDLEASPDEGHFYDSEDEEQVEESQTDSEMNLEDFSKGKPKRKLKNKERKNMATVDYSELTRSPLPLQTCSLCPYSDSQVSGLIEHIRKEHMKQESIHLPCKEPGKHSTFHEANSQTCTPEMMSLTDTCEYCGKVFDDVPTLTRHIRAHTLPFHCDKCDKKYSSRASLNVHRRIHTGETPYLCSYCGQGFRSSGHLGLHIRTHTGDRRYRCHICGKTSIQHLTRHMRMHRGEKNYLCTECGKSFTSFGELKLHTRYHTGERPYTCKHCGKGFVAKCLLTTHMRQHTGESPYKCYFCPKSFSTSKARKRHVTIHSNKKSFQCLKCGKIFRQENNFKKHLLKHTDDSKQGK